MKKVLKSRIFIFVLGFIIATAIGVYAINASEISYGNTTVDRAIDDLYNIVTNTQVSCLLISGQAETIGSKYACDPGDGNVRYFYVLKVDSTNVKMIMDRNISGEIGNTTMTHATALSYFTTGAGASLNSSWSNVDDIDLPSAQDIVDASLVINPKNNFSFDTSTSSATWWCLGSHEQDQPNGPLYCPSSAAQQRASWLFDYTRECVSRGCTNEYSNTNEYPYGYWTKDLTIDTSIAWDVARDGNLYSNSVSNSTHFGVRPVITISKSKL